MAALTSLLNAVSEPSGLWAIIIKAFENGVGSYILAVLLLTLLIRIVWAPVDTLNKKFNKKMMRGQAKIQPQLQKLEKQYAKDPQLLKQKQQELYKKANAGLGGGCLFMLVFMLLNIAIFGSMFTTMNAFSSYKVYEQYEDTKNAYANVLNTVDKLDILTLENLVKDYQNITVSIEGENLVLKNDEAQIASQKYVKDFTQNAGTENEKASSVYITELINKYIKDDENAETEFVGNAVVNNIKYSDAIQTIAMNYVEKVFDKSQSEFSFLWVGNIWVADSPFKQSVLDFNAYKGLVGKANVADNEEFIYNSFMTSIIKNNGRTNGYFILAIISIGVTYLSTLLANGLQRKKNPQMQQTQQNKMMMLIMPLIMGIFAIIYNSVFAFYMIVSQFIGALLSPIENIIIDKWEARDIRKEEEKNTVEYSRKKL